MVPVRRVSWEHIIYTAVGRFFRSMAAVGDKR